MPDQPDHTPLEVLRAASDAADDAICRRLDHNQVIARVADAVWRLGLAEGRRQATEGWERAYGVRLEWVQGPEIRDFDRLSATREDAEAHIAALAAQYRGIASVASRLVGPWETAEQPEGSDRGQS